LRARACAAVEMCLGKFEILAGLLLAAILFIVLKVIGLVVKFALIAAALGFIAGLVLARAFRR
jgi:membrane associated rhomboid family serine protease